MAREASALRRYLPDIESRLGLLSDPWAPALVDYLQRSLRAAAAYGDAGTKSSRARSAAKREAIRKAIGALPAGLEPRAVVGIARRRLLRNLEHYGLAAMPCDSLIRSEVKRYLSPEIAQPDSAARSNAA